MNMMRNAERYYDPTAGAALLTVEKGGTYGIQGR